MDQQVDLGLQERNVKQQPVIDKFEERKYEFKEKTVTSVRANSFGLVPDISSTVSISKPVINFRKRKKFRERGAGIDFALENGIMVERDCDFADKFVKMSESWEQQTTSLPKPRIVYSMPAILAGGNPWNNDFLKRAGDVESNPGPNSRYSVLSILTNLFYFQANRRF